MGNGQGKTSTAQRMPGPPPADPFAAPPPAVWKANDALRPRWSWRKRVLVTLAVVAVACATAALATVGLVVWTIGSQLFAVMNGCFDVSCR